MGFTYWTRCLACSCDGPEVGDAGFVGAPSLDVAGGGKPVAFGHLYEAFDAVGLVTADLAEHRRFLEAHAGHAVHTFSDGDDRFPIPKTDPMAGGGQATSDWTSDFPPKGFVPRVVELACKACDETFISDETDFVKPRKAGTIDPTAAALFATRVRSGLDGGMRHYEPFGDALEPIADFLAAHGGHGVRMRFRKED